MPRGAIIYGDAVEQGHPLNRGLVSWWQPLPGMSAGARVLDLTRRSHATLSGGSTWVPGPVFGSAVRGTGGSSLDVPIPAQNYPWYLSFWIWVEVYSGGFTAILDDSGRQLSAFYDTSGNHSFGNWNFGNIPVGQWVHCVETVDAAGSLNTYRNGVLSAGPAPGGANITATTLTFGANPSGGGTFPTARYADVRFGAGSPNFAGLYDQSRRGNPDTLRRIRPLSFGAAPAAGGTPFWFDGLVSQPINLNNRVEMIAI